MHKGEEHFDEEVLDRRSEDLPIGLKRRTTDTEEPRVQDIVTDYRRLQLVDLEKVDIEGGRVDEAKVHDALILCIDDNPEVLKLMKMLLADEFDLELVTSAETGPGLPPGQEPRPRPLRRHDAGHGRPRLLPGGQGRRHPEAHPHHPGDRPDRSGDAGRGHEGRGRRLHLQALRLDRAQGPHPLPAPHAPDGVGAGPHEQEPPDADLGPRRAAAVAVPLDGQVPGLGHRRQGRIHPPSLDPGHRVLHEDRRQDGLQREGARRPRAGRPPPRRRQDRRPREHPQQAGQADRRRSSS
ncbi:MAG: hypothetical protein MZU79_06415 [Anaerotruncus sp.]|nr:hypothetical protein [Anaerotruncus sp.]